KHLPYFDITEIQISGNTAIPDSLVFRKVNRYKGTNLFSVSSKELCEEVKKISRIKSIKVRKHPLSTLKLEISERQGAIYVKSLEGNLYPVDSEAIVLANYSQIYKEDLPIFSSYLTDAQIKPGTKLLKANLQRVLALHQRIEREAPEFLPIISEYYMIDNTINIVDARYGTRIIPSEDNLAQQLKRYQFVQDNGNISRRSLVDLRFENQVVVKGGDHEK
ncbi:MAG TPA: FtsQ-type POTRA domain-containing protein, partial [Candidatus Cloacimonadota bacterium]|nr:FtsQ-type POTRA domain-containing protein [Candidatus Cloacimonadota bacterium]